MVSSGILLGIVCFVFGLAVGTSLGERWVVWMYLRFKGVDILKEMERGKSPQDTDTSRVDKEGNHKI